MHLRKIIKQVLTRSFDWVVIPIRGGQLKGKWWTVSSSSRLLRGTYEFATAARFTRSLKPGDVVYDVGAHMGYYTLLAAGTVGLHGRVIAFEPHPFNRRQLRRHIKLNRCPNATVIGACVSDTSGHSGFTTTCGSGTNHMSPTGEIVVQMVSLDDLVEAGAIPPPDFIKIDVEGNELAVLQGAKKTIAQKQPALIISFHGKEIEDKCSLLLHSWNYDNPNGIWRNTTDVRFMR